MNKLVGYVSLFVLLLPACASRTTPLPTQSRTAAGEVSVTFKVPVQAAQAQSGNARRPEYFSPATTTVAIALKSWNSTPMNLGAQGNVFPLSKICQQSGAYFYCSTTVTMLSGDDVIGVLAYSTKPLNGMKGNIPLSYGEGEIQVGSGSSAEPAGAEDPTGRLYVYLSPVIYGGEVTAGGNAQANTVPITLATFVDASLAQIPSSAYGDLTIPFANTPYLTDSDTSGMTSLQDATTGQGGTSIALSSPTDSVQLINSGNEASGQKVTATLSFQPGGPDATFTIPAYMQIHGSVTASYTVPDGSSDLSFVCASAGCTRGS